MIFEQELKKKKDYDQMLLSKQEPQANASKDLFSSHSYTVIKDDSQSIFKWWLAPRKTRLKQENYSLVRQIDHIKEIKKEVK